MRELTPAQQEYFKYSQVRNKKGDMLSVYHGTKTRDFESFEYSPDRQTGQDFGEAYYFTADYESAKAYAYDQRKDPRMIEWTKQKEALIDEYSAKPGFFDAVENLKIDGKTAKEIIEEADYNLTGGEIHEVYLDLRNPLIADAGQLPFYKIYPQLFKEAKENGYDGIIVLNVNDTAIGEAKITDVFIAFHPDQIKSIDNLYPTNSKEFKDNSWDYLRLHGDKMPIADRIQLTNHITSRDLTREMERRNLEHNGKGDGFNGPGGR